MSRDESAPPRHLDEGDYRAIEDAVMETERGRWFLAEYARRNRSSETASILEALTKLEQIAGPLDGAPGSSDQVQRVLAMLGELRTAPWQGVSQRDARAAHLRPAQLAESAVTAIRRTAEKIGEVADDLRQAGVGETHAEALKLYCRDLAGAADLGEDAVERLSDLAGLLVKIEAILKGGNAPGPTPPDARAPTRTEGASDTAMPETEAAAPPTQHEPAGDHSERESAEKRTRTPTLAFLNPG